MLIRQENEQDYASVYMLVKESFATAEHTEGNEHELLAKLRKSKEFIPQLALVATQDDKIIGYVMFTKAKIGEITELILAPLAIAKECQRQGVGRSLIMEGHRIAKELGYGYCVVIGSEKYYPRFGYTEATLMGITGTAGVQSKNFMAIKLSDKAQPIKGEVAYSKAFS